MKRIKKVILSSILAATTLGSLSGCNSVANFKDSEKMMFGYVLSEVSKASISSINFIKDTNYSGTDISNVNYIEEKDKEDNTIMNSKFTLKENINLETNILIKRDFSNTSVITKITAPASTDLDDLVNCSLYAFTSEYKNFDNEDTENRKIYIDAITQAINSPGVKVEIPAEKDIERYAQVNNDTIYIVANANISQK